MIVRALDLDSFLCFCVLSKLLLYARSTFEVGSGSGSGSRSESGSGSGSGLVLVHERILV